MRRNIPLAARLPEEDFDRLMKITQVFLDSKRIEGAGGLEMTEEIAVTVAAQASFLLLWLEVGCYPSMSTVIVYPGTVRQKRSRIGRGVDLGPEHEALIAGESWRQGIVVLTWDATRHGAYHPDDGRNVVFHEFAHQLDQETGDSDGTPVGLKLRALEQAFFERPFDLAEAEPDLHELMVDFYGVDPTRHPGWADG